MTTQTLGIIIFASVVAVNVAAIALDAALVEHGVRSLSDFMRDNQWSAAIAVIIQILGVLGLAMHLSNGR